MRKAATAPLRLTAQSRQPDANVAGPEAYLDGEVVLEGDVAYGSADRIGLLTRGHGMRYGYCSYLTVRVIN